jgi:UV DNA damage endonuclease
MKDSKPLRLGFPVKILGDPEIKTHDSRRWQNNPHLKFSIGYLQDVLKYLAKHRIRMYRMSSDLAPYCTHPDMPQFHGMVKECKPLLQQFGAVARAQDLRLSFHPSQYVILNSPDEKLVKKSIWDLESQGEMLDLMELGPEAVMVIHVGGTYGSREDSRARWVRTWKKLPAHVKRRLVLEHDDMRFSAADVLWIHEQTGVRLIFDYQHFWCFNPEGLELGDTVRRILGTWPAGVRPKIHFSSPRTEMRELERRNKKTDKKEIAYVAPIWTGHADFANPFEFISFMRQVTNLEFDVMLESKSKDLAVIRLRNDLLRYAPDVAARFGLKSKDAVVLEQEQQETMQMEKYTAA